MSGMTEREVIDCPYCDRGTVTKKTGDLWWQVRTYRCSMCNGSGRVYKPEEAAA